MNDSLTLKVYTTDNQMLMIKHENLNLIKLIKLNIKLYETCSLNFFFNFTIIINNSKIILLQQINLLTVIMFHFIRLLNLKFGSTHHKKKKLLKDIEQRLHILKSDTWNKTYGCLKIGIHYKIFRDINNWKKGFKCNSILSDMETWSFK